MKQLKQFALTVLVALVGSLSANAHDFAAVNEGNTIYYRITSKVDLTCAVSYGGDSSSSYSNEYSGSVVIPSSVEYNGKTYSVTSIGDYAFSGCSGLTSINIPNSVTSIGSGAFRSCSGLTSVNIPNSVTSIGKSTFEGCLSLQSINIPNSVTSIGSSAFYGCNGLTSITIPNSVTSIGSSAFYGCSGLTSIIIPNSVTSIGDAAFCECSDLTSITIPNSVTSIASSAFSGCRGLTSITIPNSVTSIGFYAFSYCSNLTSITIPNSVTSIGDYAFRFSGLTEITSMAVTPPNISYFTFEGVSKTEAVVKVPDESVDAYKTAENWKIFSNIVGLDGGSGGQETKKCEAPTIELIDGMLVATSETEEAVCNTTITTEDVQYYVGNEPIKLSGVYKVTSFATAKGYNDSETVTMLLYWSKPSLDGESEMTLVGDINGDGKVNIADLNLVIDIMSER